jgi:type IV fimbrial biogenesis protein FimT
MSVIPQPFPGNKLSNEGGFTLLELMVVVSIAAILLGIAIPSFNATIRNNRLTAYANELVTALNVARSEAVKRGQEVVVRRTGANWENGWQVFVDIDRTTPAKENVLDAGTDIVLRVYPALRTPFTLRGDAANFPVFIRFTPAGRSNAAGIFVVCDDSDGLATPVANTSRLIMVNAVGRVSMGVDTDNTQIPENGGVDLATCQP